jgi:hypothetical protein
MTQRRNLAKIIVNANDMLALLRQQGRHLHFALKTDADRWILSENLRLDDLDDAFCFLVKPDVFGEIHVAKSAFTKQPLQPVLSCDQHQRKSAFRAKCRFFIALYVMTRRAL